MDSHDTVMATAVRLAASVDALAALAAHIRVVGEGLDVDDDVRAVLVEVVRELLGDDVAIDPAVGAQALGLARTFTRQAVDTIETPGRRGDWAVVDPVLLQGIGRLSGAIAGAFRAAEADLPGLGTMLGRAGARFLDVGTGTGWLAIATAHAYPLAQVVGIDVFGTALALARQNVEAAGLGDRIDLREQDASTLDEPHGYDAIWLPLPFLPVAVVPASATAAARALRPGGWVLAGTFAGPGDRLASLLTDLRTMRSGGHPWTGDELVGLLDAAGLVDAHEVPRTWAAPVRLWAARRA